jgi:hypothetical protein
MRFALFTKLVPASVMALAAGGLPAQGGGLDPSIYGQFEHPYQHENDGPHQAGPGWDVNGNTTFGTKVRAMHMALIPPTDNNPLAGRVLVWDEILPPTGRQIWSILKPEALNSDPDKFWNFDLTVPDHGVETRNLGCAGHSWMTDGTLLVVGGTSNQSYIGSSVAYIFDPSAFSAVQPNNAWLPQLEMAVPRWYRR